MPDAVFAGPDAPLHCSQLHLLVRCTWRSLMLHLSLVSDGGSGQAADTGSAVHFAAAEWHRGGTVAEAISSMRKAVAGFPLADMREAELHFRPYAADPRNREAELVCVERQCLFALPPAEEDATGLPVWVMGTADQVRRVQGRLLVYDIKTSQREGWDLMMDHALQLCAYAVGLTAELGEDVAPGALIRTRGYRTVKHRGDRSPPGVFWHYSLNLAGARLLMDGVRRAAASVRRGDVFAGPGVHCAWCPAGGPEVCVPKLLEVSSHGQG